MTGRIRTLLGSAELRALWDGVSGRQDDKSESGFDFAIAMALLRKRVPANDVAAALATRPREKDRLPEYFARTAAAADAVVRKGVRR